MEIKKTAPEMDALRLGMGWDSLEIGMKQVLIESAHGDSHPGSVHLDRLAKMSAEGVQYCGAKPAHFTATDICDGIAQGHEGMNYSLVSREILAGMVEIHQKANRFDGMAVISSCDKSIPAHLMAMARLNIPAIHINGGVMTSAANGFTLEQIGTASVRHLQGSLTDRQFSRLQSDACTTCGACQFMGTAGTMQVISEALGLSLPHSALMPANLKMIDQMAKQSGRALVNLIDKNIRVRDIVTPKSLHNAIVLHGAVGGSTNALLHLPAIAQEAGLDFDIGLFDTLHRQVPYLVNTRPVGQYSTELFWYAGGVPQIMLMLKDQLYTDVLTVTGKTLGENLEDIATEIEFYQGYLSNYGLKQQDIIRQMNSHGAIAILKGNIALQGAVVKYTGLSKQMMNFEGKARVFDNELSARNAILEKQIKPGDCIVIRYAGPKGSGMPEMFYTTEALCADEELVNTTALITDGRFSGASRGPCIGHISPEAAEGGNLALLQDGDIIRIDIENRTIDAIGVDFDKRRESWSYQPPQTKGILGVYQKLASSAILGGTMNG